MKTWKSKKTVCRSRSSGKFAFLKKCGMFRKQRVKAGGVLFGHLFK